jgi:hypothetical protein
MSGWDEWAQSLAAICEHWGRPQNVYAMTTDRELCFLENYARYSYTGAGDIVDLGCWLGATTFALARGLTDNTNGPGAHPIDAIDRFVWEPWMDDIARRIQLPRRHRAGEYFLDETRALLAPYSKLVRVRSLDLLKAKAHPRPIEFLFIDAMKSWPLADRIAHNYFPRLIPGRSLVVQQDFADSSPITATNHMLMWLLRDRLEPVYHVPHSCSVAFFCMSEVPAASIGKVTSTRFVPDEIAQAFDYSAGCVSADMRHVVRLCQIAYLAERGFDEDALTAVRAFVASGNIVPRSQLEHAQAAFTARRAATRAERSRGVVDEASVLLAHAAAG